MKSRTSCLFVKALPGVIASATPQACSASVHSRVAAASWLGSASKPATTTDSVAVGGANSLSTLALAARSPRTRS
jgi:hypothetical protein